MITFVMLLVLCYSRAEGGEYVGLPMNLSAPPTGAQVKGHGSKQTPGVEPPPPSYDYVMDNIKGRERKLSQGKRDRKISSGDRERTISCSDREREQSALERERRQSGQERERRQSGPERDRKTGGSGRKGKVPKQYAYI